MKRILFLVFMFFGLQGAWAQRDFDAEDKPSFMDRVYFGGGGNVQFGQDYFVIGASPLAGYMFTSRFSGGLGATYMYTRFGGPYPYNSHIYGGRVFTRYNILKSVFAMGEYEMLSLDRSYTPTDIRREWVDRLLIGGGYFQSMGPRGGFNIGILYDVFYRPGRGYNSPWVYRVGFTF